MTKLEDYIHELRNREMALRAKLFNSPIGDKISLKYGQDFFQEEVRSMGLRLIRDGFDKEGENVILEYTQHHYPTYLQDERNWIHKMMRYLRAINETLIDNLKAEQYILIKANIELPSENALFYPLKSLNEECENARIIGFNQIITLNQLEKSDFKGWLYYRSE